MKFHGGLGILFKTRHWGPCDRSVQIRSDLFWVSEMHNHFTPLSQVLERLDEKHESFAREAQFSQGRFVEDEDSRELRMGEKCRILVAKRFDCEQNRLWCGAFDDRGRTSGGRQIVVPDEPWIRYGNRSQNRIRRKVLYRAIAIKRASRAQLRRSLLHLPARKSVGFTGACANGPLPPEQVGGARAV